MRRRAEVEDIAHPSDDRRIEIADRVGRPEHGHRIGLDQPVDPELRSLPPAHPVALAGLNVADQILHLVEQQRRAAALREHAVRELERVDAVPASGLIAILIGLTHAVERHIGRRGERARELGLAGPRRTVDQDIDPRRTFADRAGEQPDEEADIGFASDEVAGTEPRLLAWADRDLEQAIGVRHRALDQPIDRPADVDLHAAAAPRVELDQPEPQRLRTAQRVRLDPRQFGEHLREIVFLLREHLAERAGARATLDRDRGDKHARVRRIEAQRLCEPPGDLEWTRRIARRRIGSRRKAQIAPGELRLFDALTQQPARMRTRPAEHRFAQRRSAGDVPADPAQHAPDDFVFVHHNPIPARRGGAQTRGFARGVSFVCGILSAGGAPALPATPGCGVYGRVRTLPGVIPDRKWKSSNSLLQFAPWAETRGMRAPSLIVSGAQDQPWRLFISGWIRVPKFSTPSRKSSKVSSTPPVLGTSAISSSIRATLA